MIQYVFDDEESLMISAEDQAWDEKTLKQLKDEHNITFMTRGDGVIPVMMKGDLVVLGSEDDGTNFFHKRYGSYETCFSKYWGPYLIEDLKKAIGG